MMYKIKNAIVQKYCWYMVRLYKTNSKKYHRINNFMYKTKIMIRKFYKQYRTNRLDAQTRQQSGLSKELLDDIRKDNNDRLKSI